MLSAGSRVVVVKRSEIEVLDPVHLAGGGGGRGCGGGGGQDLFVGTRSCNLAAVWGGVGGAGVRAGGRGRVGGGGVHVPHAVARRA